MGGVSLDHQHENNPAFVPPAVPPFGTRVPSGSYGVTLIRDKCDIQCIDVSIH
jgi:hypothetical protein